MGRPTTVFTHRSSVGSHLLHSHNHPEGPLCAGHPARHRESGWAAQVVRVPVLREAAMQEREKEQETRKSKINKAVSDCMGAVDPRVQGPLRGSQRGSL